MSTMQKINAAFLHGPIYVILFGLIFFGIGAGLSYKQYRLARDGAEAQGRVVSLAESCDDEGCSYSPVVRFSAQNGRAYTYESNYSSSPPAYDVGENVTVLYQPDNPEKANIKGEGMWFRIIFMIVGGVIIFFGLIFFGRNVQSNLREM